MKKKSKATAPKKAAKKAAKKSVKKVATKKPVKLKSKVSGFEHLPADSVEVVDETTNEALAISPVEVAVVTSEKPTQTGREIFLSRLKTDNVYVTSSLVSMKDITGMPARKGISQALISEGEIVNIVSKDYGYVPNQDFFFEVEQKLTEAGIKYVTSSTNRANSSFAVDYILDDSSYDIQVKSGNDRIIPMLHFVNTYDGGPCTGTFGFFREVCSNGLHVAKTAIGFKVRHIGKASEVVLVNIKETIELFLSNEYYDLKKKFEVLAETPITDVTDFVKYVCGKTGLLKYEASEKNPDTPSAKAQLIIDTINKEKNIVGTGANLWLGYNAFNEMLHKDKKSFAKQRQLDGELFSIVSEMAN